MTSVKTAVLLAVLAGLGVGIAVIVGDLQIIASAALLMAISIIAFVGEDHVAALAPEAYELCYTAAPDLLSTLNTLSMKAGLPAPRLFVLDHRNPNAFTLGFGRHRAIVMTSALLTLLDGDEIAGVMSHELGHIKQRDTLLMTVVAHGVMAVTAVGVGITFVLRTDRVGERFMCRVVAGALWVSAVILCLALNREREYAADFCGAKICGHPEWIASALRKILRSSAIHHGDELAFQPAIASLLFCSPLEPKSRTCLFDTHPPTALRISRLERSAQRTLRI